MCKHAMTAVTVVAARFPVNMAAENSPRIHQYICIVCGTSCVRKRGCTDLTRMVCGAVNDDRFIRAKKYYSGPYIQFDTTPDHKFLHDRPLLPVWPLYYSRPHKNEMLRFLA